MKRTENANSIAVYVRISRDDNGENFESVENQRDLLVDYVSVNKLGEIYSVYTDDNVSGSAFDRQGLESLKNDVLSARIDMVLMKDLSRLGRNNAKTLQMIDFLEENGVRILTSDGRYDSLVDNDTVGIETWVNERYVRDISRKIRSCLRFKIQRGEYLGRAPFGYRKSVFEKNKLAADDSEAYIVRLIYELYLSGLGYSAISNYLDERGYRSPKNMCWNRITVRRILCSRVYIGDTVQGVSEKVSFKSKKTRRLPEDKWVITEGTHEALISRDVYDAVQLLRKTRSGGRKLQGRIRHILNGIICCGDCKSAMYARKRKNGIAYVCGNYCRNGRAACTSHFVYEEEIIRVICRELVKLFSRADESGFLHEQLAGGNSGERGTAVDRLNAQLEAGRRHQEILYKDRLEGRISEQLFERMNSQMEKRIAMLEKETARLIRISDQAADIGTMIKAAADRFKRMELTQEMACAAVKSVTVYDETIVIDFSYGIA